MVTGAAGFIGSALCDALNKQGYHVKRALRCHRSSFDLEGHEYVETGDIGPETNCQKFLQNVDTVIHLAARVHMLRDLSSDPLKTFRKTNVQGTLRLAREAASANVRRFIFLSSIKVNGERTYELPFKEEDTACPEDFYAISKYEAEQGLKVISSESGMEVVIIRPSLVYGPGVKGNFLRLLYLIDRGVPLPFSWIDNRRSLVYLDNLVDFIIRCVNESAAAGEIFLISDDQDVSTAELIKKIAFHMGKNSHLFPVPLKILKALLILTGKRKEVYRLTDSLQVEISKAKRIMNWQPVSTLDEGINTTVRWFYEQEKDNTL